MMSPALVASEAERLKKQLAEMPAPTFSNYRQVIAGYKTIANDLTVLVRELALNLKEKDNG